ncbi:MAG TPA: biotin--[acetyl-CoA-carboxylase] ligase [Deltaproteobacteria bacterium]|nr:biotin--[acetyl-CoA-carboxylase] ligase [Deltaproteobacteria bacterium]
MNADFNSGFISEYIELDEVDSTNRVALDTGKAGLLVTARSQTLGRGTKGRTWFSPYGKNLYLTITVGKPDQRFPLVAGVALHEAISLFVPRSDVSIKWPNDIVVFGQKVCGILCEAKGSMTAVGIGINVNQTSWPDDLKDSAVSLAQVSARQYELNAVLKQAVSSIQHWFTLFYNEGFAPVRQRFLQFGLLNGYKLLTDEGLACTIVDLNMEGYLLINVSGRLKTLSGGTIHIVE